VWGSLDPRGPAARSIDDLWVLMLVLGIVAFAIFAVLLTSTKVTERTLQHDVDYGHYAHAEGLAVGLAAGWLLDRFIKKKISLL